MEIFTEILTSPLTLFIVTGLVTLHYWLNWWSRPLQRKYYGFMTAIWLIISGLYLFHAICQTGGC